MSEQSCTVVSSRQWQSHVKALRRSGLTRAEYCRRHRLSYHALAYWQRKLDQPQGVAAPVLVQVPTVKRHEVQQNRSGVSIRMESGMRIELDRQFSPEALGKVLEVLEGR